MEHGRRWKSGRDRWSEASRRNTQSKSPQCQNWQQTIPSWEKSFCKDVGLLDWETILEMKKFAFLFDNVVKWDCSAGEEALQNAKKQFWAELHGIQCDIPRPNPDLYIDEIDWDCKVDSDVILDLDCLHLDPKPEEICDSVIVFGNALTPREALSAPGWGEEDEVNFQNNWYCDSNKNGNNLDDPWETGWKKSETRKQNGWDGESRWRSGWNKEGDCKWSYGNPKQKHEDSEGRMRGNEGSGGRYKGKYNNSKHPKGW